MERKAIYTVEDEEILIERGQDWNFHEESTKEHLHTLHPYPAKFIPQIPRKAIELYSDKGDLIYDPFAGCGTTLLEASLLGRPSIGTDNNSVAILVSRAKLSKYSAANIEELIHFHQNFDSSIKSFKPLKRLIPDNKNFNYWFSEEVLLRLSSIKRMILEEPEPNQVFLLAVFSSIIVRVSFQDSDTRYSRINKEVSKSDVDKAFKNKLGEAIEQLRLMPKKKGASNVEKADARSVPFIKTGSVSLIVTSPPYLNAYDYHKYHRQRIHWIDGEVEFARDLEIGSHDEFTRTGAKPDQYFIDMNKCFEEWSRITKTGGKCLIVVGDAIVSGQPVAVADRFIELMKQQKFRLEDRWIRELHSTKRAFNGSSRIDKEHVLLFKKIK